MVAGGGLAFFVGTFSALTPLLLKVEQPLADRVAQKQGKSGEEDDLFWSSPLIPGRKKSIPCLAVRVYTG